MCRSLNVCQGSYRNTAPVRFSFVLYILIDENYAALHFGEPRHILLYYNEIEDHATSNFDKCWRLSQLGGFGLLSSIYF